MSLESAFAPVEAEQRARVLYETWGHLYPEFSKKYTGTILFTLGGYESLQILNDNFDGLPNSPEFYNDLQDFTDRFMNRPSRPEDGVWEWSGTYIKRKNGNGWFSKGSLRKIYSF